MHPKTWISKFSLRVNKPECRRGWYFKNACSFTIPSSLQLFEYSRVAQYIPSEKGAMTLNSMSLSQTLNRPLISSLLSVKPIISPWRLVTFQRNTKDHRSTQYISKKKVIWMGLISHVHETLTESCKVSFPPTHLIISSLSIQLYLIIYFLKT